MSDQHINIIALEELKGIMGNDFALLIDTFVKDSDQRIEVLGRAIALADAEDLRSIAHSFKGSSSNVGAPFLAELCFQLETMGRENDLDQSMDVYTLLKQEYAAVKSLLQSMV